MTSEQRNEVIEKPGVPNSLLSNKDENQPQEDELIVDDPPRASETVNPDESQSKKSRERFQRFEAVFDTVFGSCTGGMRAAASFFSQCRETEPQQPRQKGTLSDILDRRYRGKGWQRGENDGVAGIPLFLAPTEKVQDEGFELESFRCEDSVSAISACTLDEMVRLHHLKVSPSRALREKQPLSLRKFRSNTTHGSKSSEQPSLSASTTGSSNSSEDKNSTIIQRITAEQPTELWIDASGGVGGRQDDQVTRIIQQHDLIMSEVAADLHER